MKYQFIATQLNYVLGYKKIEMIYLKKIYSTENKNKSYFELIKSEKLTKITFKKVLSIAKYFKLPKLTDKDESFKKT